MIIICAVLPVSPRIPTIVTYLLTELTSLLAPIPLPVYKFVYFTILFFYAFQYTGLALCLFRVGFGFGLAGLSWSRSWSWSHTPWSRSGSRSHCLTVSLTFLLIAWKDCTTGQQWIIENSSSIVQQTTLRLYAPNEQRTVPLKSWEVISQVSTAEFQCIWWSI